MLNKDNNLIVDIIVSPERTDVDSYVFQGQNCNINKCKSNFRSGFILIDNKILMLGIHSHDNSEKPDIGHITEDPMIIARHMLCFENIKTHQTL